MRFAFAALVVLAGCPADVPHTGCDDVASCQCPNGGRTCDSDRVCPHGFCDKTNDGDDIPAADDPLGCCVVVDDPCASCGELPCDVRRALCVTPLCDPSVLGGGQCTADTGGTRDCCGADQLCEIDEGSPVCVDAPLPVGACFVVVNHRRVAIGVGDTDAAPAIALSSHAVELAAVGTDDDGKLAPHATFAWSVAGEGAAVDGDGAFTATCPSGTCAFTVTATAPSGASCDGVVDVLAPSAPDETRIVLVDADTGARLAGVDAVAVVSGAPVSDVTDDDGAVSFAGTIDAVSVFPTDHDWQTLVTPAQLDVGSDFIVSAHRRTRPDEVVGISGTFDFAHVHTTGDVKLGFAGLAFPDIVDDMPNAAASFFGPASDRVVNVEGITNPGGQLVPFASNVVIKLGDEPIQGDFVALAPRPGPTIAWALGGEVALADVGPIITGVLSGVDATNAGNILAGVLPFFGRFDHAVTTNVELTSSRRPRCDNGAFTCGDLLGSPTTCDGRTGLCTTVDGNVAPVDTAAWRFASHTAAPDTLLMFSADYAVPPMPAGSVGVFVVTGVDAAGTGFVPMGLTVGLDDPNETDVLDQHDGVVDSLPSPDAPARGHVRIDYAPEHDGLEGAPWVTIAFAVADFGTRATSASALVHRTKHIEAANEFSAGAFLALPSGAFVGGAVSLDADGSADVARVRLEGDGGAWDVWLPDGAASFSTKDFGAPDRTREASAAAQRFLVRTAASTSDALFDVGDAVDAWSRSVLGTTR